MICSACQYANEDDARFCEQCGQAFEKPCPACGTPAKPQARFCRQCGHTLTPPDAVPIAITPASEARALDDKLDRLQRYLPSHLSEKILASRGRLSGERKIVTVLFADIAGYTTLCEQLGEEIMFAVMDALYELLIHEAHRYEGTVNELTGDGVVAFFGAPLAVEQAPQRAVRAALAMQREIARYSAGFKRQYGRRLQVRVGINTGPVIVGTVGNNLRMDYKAVGDTVNLAARMEQSAAPGTIQITEHTYKLVAGYVCCDDLGPLDIKGKADRVRAYRVTGERGTRARIDVERERGFTRFTGRERELELLHDALIRTRDGRGQAISIVGEAGLGKSRLLHEFRNALADADLTFLEGRCSPYGATTAYLPIVDILKHNFRIEAHDSEADIVQKVETGLQRMGGDLASMAPYVLRLLLSDYANTTLVTLPPEAVKRRTFEALQRLTVHGAERRPLVLTFEDLQWADKTTEECLTFLLDHIAGARVLLLCTHRPEFVSTWSRKSYHSTITLTRLSRRECHDMLMALLGTAEIQEALVELVIDKSEGVPFFLEELVQALRETGSMVERDGQWQLTTDAVTVQVPATIHDVLRIGDYRGISWATYAYGWVAELAKDFARALESLNFLIAMGKASGGFQHEVSAAFAWGAAFLLRLVRYQEAFEYCQEGLEISLRTSNKLAYGNAYMVLAELYATEEYCD